MIGERDLTERSGNRCLHVLILPVLREGIEVLGMRLPPESSIDSSATSARATSEDTVVWADSCRIDIELIAEAWDIKAAKVGAG